MRALLTEARPARAFFFTTRRDFEPVMAIFDEMGYELAASTTRTRLTMYERRLNR